MIFTNIWHSLNLSILILWLHYPRHLCDIITYTPRRLLMVTCKSNIYFITKAIPRLQTSYQNHVGYRAVILPLPTMQQHAHKGKIFVLGAKTAFNIQVRGRGIKTANISCKYQYFSRIPEYQPTLRMGYTCMAQLRIIVFCCLSLQRLLCKRAWTSWENSYLFILFVL